MTAESTLHAIEEHLKSGIGPIELIEQMLPRTKSDARIWAHQLTAFEEYRGRIPDNVIGLARVIVRRAMKEQGLILTDDGRIIERSHKEPIAPPPTATFSLTIRGEPVRVQFTRDYFPVFGMDHVQFRSPHEPVQPMPLSETGWWSQFVPHDAVEACGGPEAFAKLLAAAQVEGQHKEFMATLEGEWPEQSRQKANAKQKRPVIGKHTNEIATEQPATEQDLPPPGSLF